MISDHHPDGDARRHFGVYPAIVTDIVDPDSLGRIEIKLPWLGTELGGSDVRAWATLTTPYADDDQGILVLPAVDTQVVVAFEAGDLRRPYILGSCWNGKESLPVSPAQPNNKRVWKSRAKSLIEFDDTDGAAKVTISMQSGHKLVLDDSAQSVTLSHQNGCTLTMEASGQVTVKANSTVMIDAPATHVTSQTTTFDGMVNCTTLNASISVVSPIVSTAAGNLL